MVVVPPTQGTFLHVLVCSWAHYLLLVEPQSTCYWHQSPSKASLHMHTLARVLLCLPNPCLASYTAPPPGAARAHEHAGRCREKEEASSVGGATGTSLHAVRHSADGLLQNRLTKTPAQSRACYLLIRWHLCKSQPANQQPLHTKPHARHHARLDETPSRLDPTRQSDSRRCRRGVWLPAQHNLSADPTRGKYSRRVRSNLP